MTKEVIYDPIKGRFYANGKEVGSINKRGYRYVYYDGKMCRGGRLAWYLTYGKWPTADIDHINRKRDDDRLCNLREVSRTENLRNTRTRQDNRSGVVGVSWTGKLWHAYINTAGKRKNLGYFDTFREAVEARQLATKQYWT